MSLFQIYEKIVSFFKKRVNIFENDTYYLLLDKLYIEFDKKRLRRTKGIRLVPSFQERKGGKISYGEWCFTIGVFQTLINDMLIDKKKNVILDIGCGTGLLAIACEPLLGEEGKYIGIDIVKKDIIFCQQHYSNKKFSFIYHPVNNPIYAPNQQKLRNPYPIKDNYVDLITALSVWTHLNEKDALFYFKEVNRILKPGGKAIITFFYLNEEYEDSLKVRDNKIGNYHYTNKMKWIFSKRVNESTSFYHPKWTNVPEEAIGVNESGIKTLLNGTDLKLVKIYRGNWKEKPGIFFQDILIFQK
jgi:ubiquinone/menaquinone biosynthesis C-methylase UbiE